MTGRRTQYQQLLYHYFCVKEQEGVWGRTLPQFFLPSNRYFSDLVERGETEGTQECPETPTHDSHRQRIWLIRHGPLLYDTDSEVEPETETEGSGKYSHRHTQVNGEIGDRHGSSGFSSSWGSPRER